MDKSKFKVYATAKETLDSCGMTREEFLNQIDVGGACSGFSSDDGYTECYYKCDHMFEECGMCPIDSKRTKEQIISWLNETVPEKTESKSEILDFDYDRIMQKNTVVHCDTHGKANELLKWSDSKGLKIYTGSRWVDFDLSSHKRGYNCYEINSGNYCTKSYYEEKNYTILKYEDVILPSKFPSKEDFKTVVDCGGKSIKEMLIDDVIEKLKPTPEISGGGNFEYVPQFKAPIECDNGFATINMHVGNEWIKTKQSNPSLEWEHEYTKIIKKETEMDAVVKKEIRTLEEHKLYIEANGLSKKDIKLVTDVTDNKLYLETIDQEEINLDKDLKDLDFTIKGEWNIDKKYDVSKTKSSISKGILKIVVPVQKDRIQTVTVD